MGYPCLRCLLRNRHYLCKQLQHLTTALKFLASQRTGAQTWCQDEGVFSPRVSSAVTVFYPHQCHWGSDHNGSQKSPLRLHLTFGRVKLETRTIFLSKHRSITSAWRWNFVNQRGTHCEHVKLCLTNFLQKSITSLALFLPAEIQPSRLRDTWERYSYIEIVK